MTETEDILRISIYGSFALFAVLSSSLVFFVMAFKRKKQAFKAERELLEERFRSSLAESKLEISEQTLKEVAREIHDNLGQRLTLAIQALTKEEASSDEIREMLLEVMNDMRNLSRSMHGSYIHEKGLDLALERECRLFEKAIGQKCTYTPPEGIIDLSEQEEIILFRCIQELLNNASKYSEATEIDVIVKNYTDKLIITIADNGNGFDPDKIEEGIGLRSIRERCEMLKATFHVSSSLKNGSTFTIKLPYS